ncbi:MAG: hypothetical protein LCH84_07870 [Gemmatimonadetes bacterium]|nr:hypothetical protein [Gemmatimonadota bacterium]
MSTLVLDYTLDSLTPANADGTHAATVTNATVVAGPGTTTLGSFPSALQFAGSGGLTVSLPVATLQRDRFAVRVVFRLDAKPAARQTLVACGALPLSVHVEPGTGTSDFDLVAVPGLAVANAGGASTRFLFDLTVGTWYAADIVYDTDTLAVSIDDVVRTVHAYPAGTLAPANGDLLRLGVALDGSSHALVGSVAALQLLSDLPIALEAPLDERRAHPQWYLTYKEEELRGTLNAGAPTAGYVYDAPSGAWIQQFAGVTLMYADAVGLAFEMHGAIRDAYWAYPQRMALGHLISDEIDTARGGGRRNLFSRSGLYWSRATGVRAVVGQLWVDYEAGGESAWIGLPVGGEEPVPGGLRQRFQGGHLYHRAGAPRAFEVHGAILAHYLATGEVQAWGFPTTNEGDVRDGATVLGRSSEFERCTIYWSGASGAFAVYGDIRTTWRNAGGPAGPLGFPTSDEGDVPGAAGARYNTFQRGSVVWFGSLGETYVCQPFDITLGRFDTKESEGWGRGSNDVYVHAGVEDNGTVIHHERIPGSGDSNGRNVYTVNRTLNVAPNGIMPNRADRVITLTLDVWDSDWPDDDDHLGYYEYRLEMANAWGLRGNRTGLFSSGSFSHINTITWSVSPRVNEALLTDNQRWWGVDNRGTPELTWAQYATAFRDVDSDTEWWDPTDWLAAIFYEAAVKGLAKSGNCFGMSLEAINSYKHRSLLRLPLDRFADATNQWEAVRGEFNVRHQYQVGASAIWWFAGQFVSGNTHDPVDVFRATRRAHARGEDPVLCLSQNWDFSGAPHCILPVGWDDSAKPWRIFVRDPNFPSPQTPARRVVEVDPDANTFRYVGSSTYTGAEWSGGRLHYMPYSVLCEQPRTPVFEALMLLMSGAILIVGDDGETVSLTDDNGVDLDAFGADAVARLQSGRSVADKFVPFRGFDGHTDRCAVEREGEKPVPPRFDKPPRPRGISPAELHLRPRPRVVGRHTRPDRRTGTDWQRLTLREYLCQWAPARIRRTIEANSAFVSANGERLMIHLLQGAASRTGATLSNAAGAAVRVDALRAAAPALPTGNTVVHTLRGVRRGTLHYALKMGLTEVLVGGASMPGDEHRIRLADVGTQTGTVRITSSRDQRLTLRIETRWGAGRDRLRLDLEGVPVAQGQELALNVKPGLGGVDVVGAGALQARVTLEVVRRGVRYAGRFDVASDNGLRVVPSTYLTRQQLKVAQIGALFGPSLRTELVQPL